MIINTIKRYSAEVILAAIVSGEYLIRYYHEDIERLWGCILVSSMHVGMTEMTAVMMMAVLLMIFQAQSLQFFLKNKSMLYTRYNSQKDFLIDLLKYIVINALLFLCCIILAIIGVSLIHGVCLKPGLFLSVFRGYLFYLSLSFILAVFVALCKEETAFIVAVIYTFLYTMAVHYSSWLGGTFPILYIIWMILPIAATLVTGVTLIYIVRRKFLL